MSRYMLTNAGMFLWVRLVLWTVEDLFYEGDIEEVVSVLPEGLYPL